MKRVQVIWFRNQHKNTPVKHQLCPVLIQTQAVGYSFFCLGEGWTTFSNTQDLLLALFQGPYVVLGI